MRRTIRFSSSGSYLSHLCRYIHRNPIDGKNPLVARLEDWPYSNYLDWIGKRGGSLISHEFVEAYFPRPEDDVKFVHEYKSPQKLEDGLKPYFFD